MLRIARCYAVNVIAEKAVISSALYEGCFFWGVYNDVHYVKQALLYKTCLQQGLTRYVSNYPVGVILYNKQVLRLRATATLNILHHQLGGTFDANFRRIDA